MTMTLEGAIKYCEDNGIIEVTFYGSHVEAFDGYYRVSEVEFVDCIQELKRLNEDEEE